MMVVLGFPCWSWIQLGVVKFELIGVGFIHRAGLLDSFNNDGFVHFSNSLLHCARSYGVGTQYNIFHIFCRSV